MGTLRYLFQKQMQMGFSISRMDMEKNYRFDKEGKMNQVDKELMQEKGEYYRLYMSQFDFLKKA